MAYAEKLWVNQSNKGNNREFNSTSADHISPIILIYYVTFIEAININFTRFSESEISPAFSFWEFCFLLFPFLLFL